MLIANSKHRYITRSNVDLLDKYRFVRYLGETMNHIFRMAIFVLIFAIPSFCLAQEFYKGKTVTFVLGSSPGGGFDVYTRERSLEAYVNH